MPYVAPASLCSPPDWPPRSRRPLAGTAEAEPPTGPAEQRQRARGGGGRRAAAAAKLTGKHSLRAPVTDENFYFVMADRFENGSHGQRHGRDRR